MKKSILLILLALVASVGLTAAEDKTKAAMTRYTSCSNPYFITEEDDDGYFVFVEVRDCTEYDVNWSTFPPTTTVIRTYTERLNY